MTALMLDTDTSSYIIKRRPPGVLEKFETYSERLCVSAITAAELRFGAEKSRGNAVAGLVEDFLARLPIMPWADEATVHYARLRATLERAGRPIGNMDLLIAAHALALGAKLITNNLRHFGKIAGLKTETWV